VPVIDGARALIFASPAMRSFMQHFELMQMGTDACTYSLACIGAGNGRLVPDRTDDSLSGERLRGRWVPSGGDVELAVLCTTVPRISESTVCL